MIPETFTASHWYATAPPAPSLPPVEFQTRADVVVVGAGILGLSLARTLARAGADVLVVERAAIGHGASGRNGGLIVPAFPRLGPTDVIARLGAPGERLVAAVGGSARRVFEIIATEAIACDAVQGGWLMPAHAPDRLAGFQRRAADWARHGHAVEVLDEAQAARRIGSHWWHGALFDPDGGHLDPLAYTRGLARAALRAGARIVTDCPVTRIEDARLVTARGTIAAGRIVLATNAHPETPLEGFSAGAVPLHVWQMASEPYPQAVVDEVLPGSAALSDTRNDLFAVRWTADRRLVIGGMAVMLAGAGARLARRNARRIAEAFPVLGPVRIAHVWHGRASLTPDLLPRLMERGPLLAITACNGRGIAMNTILGEALARYVATGERAAVPLPFDDAPRRIANPALAALVPRLLLPLGRLKDRMDRR